MPDYVSQHPIAMDNAHRCISYSDQQKMVYESGHIVYS